MTVSVGPDIEPHMDGAQTCVAKAQAQRIMAREMPRTPFDDDAPPDFDALRTPADMRAFAPDQLVACPACLRANAPTRQRCLYCGATLPATTGAANLRRPAQRKLEEWEQGFNVVLPPRAETETELPREPLINA